MRTEPELRSELDLKIFVDTDPDLRLARRIERDINERGRTVESVLELGLENGQGYLLGRPGTLLNAPTLVLIDLMTGKVPSTESAA